MVTNFFQGYLMFASIGLLAIIVARANSEESDPHSFFDDESNLVKRSAEPIFFGKGGGRGGGHGHGGGRGGKGGRGGYGHGKRSAEDNEIEESSLVKRSAEPIFVGKGGGRGGGHGHGGRGGKGRGGGGYGHGK